MSNDKPLGIELRSRLRDWLFKTVDPKLREVPLAGLSSRIHLLGVLM